MFTIVNKRLIGFLIGFVFGIGCILVTFLTWPTLSLCPAADRITIGDITLRAAYACTPAEQIKGLGFISQEAWLQRADVMVFQFEEPKVRHFWMQGMEFPLDVLWVHKGEIVKMESNIPPPIDGADPVRMNSSPYLVETVIELPAGSIEKYGFQALTGTHSFVNLRP